MSSATFPSTHSSSGFRPTSSRRSERSAVEHLWAGWRSEYIATAGQEGDGCVFCRIIESDASAEERFVVWEGDRCVALLNAYPYTSGHLMVLPRRHVGELEELDAVETSEVW